MFATTQRSEMFWGPAVRDPEHPLHPSHLAALDQFDERDADGERPDDN